MRKKLVSVIVAAMCMSLVGCTNKAEGNAETASKTTETEAAEATAKSDIRVAVVYSGNLGDKSYNDSCDAGA